MICKTDEDIKQLHGASFTRPNDVMDLQFHKYVMDELDVEKCIVLNDEIALLHNGIVAIPVGYW